MKQSPCNTGSHPIQTTFICSPVLVHPEPLHQQQTSSQTKASIDSSNETMQITTEQSTPASLPPPKSAIMDLDIHEHPKRIIRLPSKYTDYDMSQKILTCCVGQYLYFSKIFSSEGGGGVVLTTPPNIFSCMFIYPLVMAAWITHS